VTQDELKRQVAEAALAYVPAARSSASARDRRSTSSSTRSRASGSVAGAVSSSAASTARLVARGIRVVDAGDVESLPVCVDGADEIDPRAA
jgi:ribose 5-phosphate isomerase A